MGRILIVYVVWAAKDPPNPSTFGLDEALTAAHLGITGP